MSESIRFTTCIVREPCATLGDGLTTADLGRPDPELAQRQHAQYVRALEQAGVAVTCLESEGFPDGHFVEDTAVVVREMAVITRPGAPSRRGECASMATELAKSREIRFLESPGCLDGGDVLIVGKQCFIGLSSRTNAAGAAQLAGFLNPFGYRCRTVPLQAGLHLKSDINVLADDLLLASPALARNPTFGDWRVMEVSAREVYAANVVRINEHVLVPAEYPETRSLIEAAGLQVLAVETSEFRKMDGGLTCLSLRY